jgi:WD40 repeat protein
MASERPLFSSSLSDRYKILQKIFKYSISANISDIHLLERGTWKQFISLKGEHTQTATIVSWSPNGKYLASSGLDFQVLIWNLTSKQVISRIKCDQELSGIRWSPTTNMIALVCNISVFVFYFKE